MLQQFEIGVARYCLLHIGESQAICGKMFT